MEGKLITRDPEVPVFAEPRDIEKLTAKSGNLYRSLVILGKRSNQLAKEEKEELVAKLNEFAPKTDTLEEVFDNREQLEISAHYERLPKVTLVSTHEFLQDKIYWRDPGESEEEENTDV